MDKPVIELKKCPVCGSMPVIKSWKTPCDWMPPIISRYVCPVCRFGDPNQMGSEYDEDNRISWNDAVEEYVANPDDRLYFCDADEY